MKKSSQFLKQAIVLIFLMLVGMLLAMTLAVAILSVTRHDSLSAVMSTLSGGNDVTCLRMLQAFQSLFVFILPAILLAVFSRESVGESLSLRKSQHRPVVDALMAVLSMIVMAPLVSVLAQLNEAIRLPSCFSGIEEWMRVSAESAEATVNVLIGTGSLTDFLMSVLIIAFLAAISEEWLFRGSLLGLIRKALPAKNLKRDYVAAIWITAAVFSAFHLQFDGFLPRLLLGAWLGYLLMWTRSIWIPVLAHFTNNMLALLGIFAVKWAWVEEPLEDSLFAFSDNWKIDSALSLLSLILVFWIARYFRSRP